MNLSANIFSKDNYFTFGLIELLGVELIKSFFLIIDLDSSNNLLGLQWVGLSKKNIIAFASSDLAFYKSELFEQVTVLDKRSSIKSILSFFLKRNMSGNYHTKFHLSPREKQMLSMLSKGESNQKIAEEFGVNIKTIYTHRRNLMIKLGCKNRITLQNLFFNNEHFF